MVLIALVSCDCAGAPNPPTPTPTPTPTPDPSPDPSPEVDVGWLKGQLHMHTGFSGDSETPLDDALDWYAAHGFDFVVVTDHNHVTVGHHDAMLVLPGAELTHNIRRCVPAPEPGDHCSLHVNALVVDADHEGFLPLRTFGIPSRADVFTDSMRVAERLGGIAQLNHPNYRYGADADLLAELAQRGLRLFEVANEALDSNNDGGDRPSTEAMWDDVLSRGLRLWGTATDDAHHYLDADAVRARGRIAFEGNRGWVMVRASRTAEAIRTALSEGDFYASNGVTLESLHTEGSLRITTAEPHDVDLIGRGGRVLQSERGRSVLFDLDALNAGEYVRAVVRDDAGRRAWTQPVFR